MGIHVPIKINDATLREGDQAPLTSFNREEKMVIAAMLEELGVDNIEAGFAASRADYGNIKGVFEVIDEKGPIIATLGRAKEGDTKASLDVIKGYKNARIHIFLATSDEHINAKFEKTGLDIIKRREALLETVKKEVGRAKRYKKTHNKNLEIEFSPEDATGNALIEREDSKKYLDFESDQFNFLVEVCETAIKCGATIINTPDTLGNLLPHETELFFKELNKRLSHLRGRYSFELSAHIHNDLGMASANAISAIRGGATQIEVTINGVGERTGNTPLHEIIGLIGEKGHAILDDDREVILSEKLKPELVGPISEFVRRILNLNKSLQTPFIGALSDVDGSGVHNAAVEVYGGTKNKAKYGGASIPEFFSPRGGANQIVSMLEKFGIYEKKDAQIISSVTAKACQKAEEVKALYGVNILHIYMKELQEEPPHSFIEINGNTIGTSIYIGKKRIVIKGEGKGENGFIDGFIKGINEYLGENTVDIENIEIINKPTLKDAYDTFLEEVSDTSHKLSDSFSKKVNGIIGEEAGNIRKSKQVGIAHVKLKVGDQVISSVSSSSNIDYAIAQAIIEGILPTLIEKHKK